MVNEGNYITGPWWLHKSFHKRCIRTHDLFSYITLLKNEIFSFYFYYHIGSGKHCDLKRKATEN